MLFNSILFLAFFAVVYFIYWNLTGKSRRALLIFASIIFYAAWGLQREGWWGLRWTVHFLLMASMNYLLIRAMLVHPGWKKALIRLIVILDLSNLGIFKYFGFLREILLDLGVHLPQEVRDLSIFLPLAISFYTFQMMAYAIDVHRGQITRDEGPSRFMFFVMFFPQLIAGPIMRSTDFMPQMDRPDMPKEQMYGGLWLILGGLFKKVLLADPMGIILAPVYREPQIYTGWSIMLAGMCFSLQVYCDFSGYTDIARGCARLLGYEIPENFKAPFFARSARELWQRWHITLATWLRDYIYFPLGGNRLGPVRTYVNLFVTFTLGGLWHGADYTFVLWGALWGFLLAIERFFESRLGIRTTPEKSRILLVLKIFLMFVLFSIGAIMFRSQRVHYPDGRLKHTSGHIMQEMLVGTVTHFPGSARREYVHAGGDDLLAEMTFGPDVLRLKEIGPMDNILFMFLALFFFHLIQYKENLFAKWRKYDFWLLLIIGAIMGGILMPALATGGHQFIYFVF